MNKIIIVSGQAGVGKTTTAKLLLSNIDKSAYVEADSLAVVSPFIFNDDLVVLCLNNALSVISNYFTAGYSTVIFSGFLGKQSQLDYLINGIKDKSDIYLVWLEAQKEVRQNRKKERNRDESDQEKWLNFVDGLASENLHLVDMSKELCIDTTYVTTGGIVEEILKFVMVAKS